MRSCIVARAGGYEERYVDDALLSEENVLLQIGHDLAQEVLVVQRLVD